MSRCDCFCRGRCPLPFEVGTGPISQWQCPRDAVYEMVWDDDTGGSDSVMCTPCTATRRKQNDSPYETLISVRSL